MKRFLRGPGIYLLIILVIILLTSNLGLLSSNDDKVLSYNPEFLDLVKQNKISSIVIIENTIYGLFKDTTVKEKDFPKYNDFKVFMPSQDVLNRDLRQISAAQGKSGEDLSTKDIGFTIKYEPKPEQPWILSFLPYLLLLVLVGGLLYFLMQQSQGGGNRVMSFGKSRARMSVDDKNKKTFDDVAGADEEKEELKEIVEFLRSPKRFLDMGARIPKGVLLIGPPGTGKTLLAKAVAGEAGVPFFSISGSDFVEMFVGVGASRVRDLFETAKKNSPCIVFIDEIDAVGRHRGAGMGGGHDEREQTLNQLLVEMDGFNINEGIIILAATNRPDILDPAMLRPGRFDRQITVNAPDVKGREEILQVHAQGKPFDEEVDLKVLAKRTPGFTGADLENVLNEAAILAARHSQPSIHMKQLEEAITRVIAGPQKRSRVITDKDKRTTAYHEAGHAVIAKVLPNCDPVHEVSIIPRGRAAGYTMTLPEEDRMFMSRSRMLDEISMLLGGLVAEKVILEDISTGSSNDLKRATELTRKMIVEYGMNDIVGPVYYGNGEEIFIGRDYGHTKNYSEKMASTIDEETRNVIQRAYDKTEKIIKDNIQKMHEIANRLIDNERIDGEEFNSMFESAPAS